MFNMRVFMSVLFSVEHLGSIRLVQGVGKVLQAFFYDPYWKCGVCRKGAIYRECQ